MLRGKDNAASYHLAVVVDDVSQGVSDVVRGRDLLNATSAHRLLQSLLGLAPPRYRHHRLVLDAKGAKMSKSASSPPLRALREAGYSAFEVRAALGFEESQRAAARRALQLTFAVTVAAAGAPFGACAIN